jgi:hypothetical protein
MVRCERIIPMLLWITIFLLLTFAFRVHSHSYEFTGEMDWKILCIDSEHPKASKLNGKSCCSFCLSLTRSSLCIHFYFYFYLDLNDIDVVFPGLMKVVFEFLRDYKIPDGKPANKFAFDNTPRDKVSHSLALFHWFHWFHIFVAICFNCCR